MMPPTRTWHRIGPRLRVLVALLAGGAALQAAVAQQQHALIMSIGSYAEPSAKLQGVEQDTRAAHQMARLLGVPEGQIVELRNAELNFATMRRALRELSWRVQPGDRVMVYFSGHGSRQNRADAPGCQAGLVTHEGRLMLDAVLDAHLSEIAQRAARVIMFTDTCHAAAIASPLSRRSLAGLGQIKTYPQALKAGLTDALAGPDGSVPDACSTQVNLSRRALPAPGTTVIHLGAAAENEAAFATPQGSLATQAWLSCLQRDARRTASGLTECAQTWVNQHAPWSRQTVSSGLNGGLPLLE